MAATGGFSLPVTRSVAPPFSIAEFDLFLMGLDGVLINTDVLTYKAWGRAFQERGIPFNYTFDEYVVLKDDRSWAQIVIDLLASHNVDVTFPEMRERRRAYFWSMLDSDQLALKAGAGELIERLLTDGRKFGIVTRSTVAEMDIARSRLPILNMIPAQRWYTREDTAPEAAKPSPQGYNTALQDLYTPGDRVMGIENSARGLGAILNMNVPADDKVATIVGPVISDSANRLRSTYINTFWLRDIPRIFIGVTTLSHAEAPAGVFNVATGQGTPGAAAGMDTAFLGVAPEMGGALGPGLAGVPPVAPGGPLGMPLAAGVGAAYPTGYATGFAVESADVAFATPNQTCTMGFAGTDGSVDVGAGPPVGTTGTGATSVSSFIVPGVAPGTVDVVEVTTRTIRAEDVGLSTADVPVLGAGAQTAQPGGEGAEGEIKGTEGDVGALGATEAQQEAKSEADTGIHGEMAFGAPREMQGQEGAQTEAREKEYQPEAMDISAKPAGVEEQWTQRGEGGGREGQEEAGQEPEQREEERRAVLSSVLTSRSKRQESDSSSYCKKEDYRKHDDHKSSSSKRSYDDEDRGYEYSGASKKAYSDADLKRFDTTHASTSKHAQQLLLKPAASDLIQRLAREGRKFGVVTRSTVQEVDIARSRLPILKLIPPQRWYTREDTAPGAAKPSPQGYNTALQDLYVTGSRVIGIENGARGLGAILNMNVAADNKVAVIVAPVISDAANRMRNTYINTFWLRDLTRVFIEVASTDLMDVPSGAGVGGDYGVAAGQGILGAAGMSTPTALTAGVASPTGVAAGVGTFGGPMGGVGTGTFGTPVAGMGTPTAPTAGVAGPTAVAAGVGTFGGPMGGAGTGTFGTPVAAGVGIGYPGAVYPPYVGVTTPGAYYDTSGATTMPGTYYATPETTMTATYGVMGVGVAPVVAPVGPTGVGATTYDSYVLPGSAPGTVDLVEVTTRTVSAADVGGVGADVPVAGTDTRTVDVGETERPEGEVRVVEIESEETRGRETVTGREGEGKTEASEGKEGAVAMDVKEEQGTQEREGGPQEGEEREARAPQPNM
ncbi:hypothetical protein CBR_g39251 [Chara braunii]|uniref:Uncharacterized protein n=1 Tax=Chara braunii TaxID=69332 RepID=A0A388K0Z2_CHABU|nr:hypothetical protein CBR_g39251 [Chara braunii]|eukprot:GBG63709.1 hypothetical protein CBR_g39251 [Chara braunii]